MSTTLAVERGLIISAIVPINTTGAAANGDWVHMKGHRKLAIIIQQGAWAGGTSAVTVEQATDASGTSAKAVSFDTRYENTALTDDVLATTTVTSNTFALSAANKLNVIEIDASDLDAVNGFYFVRVVCATPGANNDLISALYLLYGSTHEGSPDNMPTAIA